MSSTTDKALKLDLSQYTPVSTAEKVDRSGWVNFGADNLLPLYITELAQSSPIHGALCISISDMIKGQGLNAGNYQDRVDALNTYGAFEGCARDLKLYGGFYLEVIYSVDRKTLAKLNHIPFEECRIAVTGEDEEECGVYHSADWSQPRKKKNKPTFIPKYNVNTAIDEPRQVYWCFDYTGSQTYPKPDYWSAVNYIELSRQIGIFHVSNILNGMFPSTIISFFNGEQDADSIRKLRNDYNTHLGAAANSGKTLFLFNEPGAQPPKVEAYPLSDADKQYEYLTNTSRTEVMLAHRVTTPLIFGIRGEGQGFGNNKDEMVIGLEIFTKQVVEPKQRKLSTAFEEVLAYEMPGIEIQVIPNTPIMTEQGATATMAPAAQVAQPTAAPAEVSAPASTSAPAAPDAAATDVNVAATALNGAQIASMLDIITQVVQGLMPISAAKAVMAASFPTLSSAQVDAIFADIKQGTPPTTPAALVATLSREKKKSERSDVDMTAEDEQYWLDRLRGCGEVMDLDEWELVHEAEALRDSEIERQFCESLKDYQLASLEGYANEGDKSAWGDRGLYKLRYAYSQNLSRDANGQLNSREFCVEMVGLSKDGVVYRYEDIQAMSDAGENGEFAPAGSSSYDIFKYVGGCFCHHHWKRQIWFRKREKGKFLPNKGLENDQRVGNVPYVKQKGIEGIAPIDRPGRGSLKYG
jgi:hypothetical protein